MTRRSWIGEDTDVTQKRQCVLDSVVRGTVKVVMSFVQRFSCPVPHHLP